MLTEFTMTPFMVMMCGVQKDYNDHIFPIQLQLSYRDVRPREELIDFIVKNGHPNEPSRLSMILKCLQAAIMGNRVYRNTCTWANNE